MSLINRYCYSLFSTNMRRSATRPLQNYSSQSTSQPRQQQYGQSETAPLTDGRVLGFAEYGEPTGKPLLWFHGFPGSRVETADWDPLAKKLNIRLFGVDRPGFGLSTFQPNRKLVDWPDDVRQLAEFLGLKQFHILGGSGGGPYVIACAHALPKETLLGAGVLAGAGPPESGYEGMPLIAKIYYSVSAWPIVAALTRKAIDWTVMPSVRDPDPQVFRNGCDKILKAMSEKDRAGLTKNPASYDALVEGLREAFRQGSSGTAEDAKILGQDWGFKLADIDCNSVKLYYGVEDINTPVHQARHMAKHIKNSVLKEYPGETHFTAFSEYEEEILRDVMGIPE